MFNSAKATDSSPLNHNKLNSNLNSPFAERYQPKNHHLAKSHAVSQKASQDDTENNKISKEKRFKSASKKPVDPNKTPKKRGRPAKICKS